MGVAPVTDENSFASGCAAAYRLNWCQHLGLPAPGPARETGPNSLGGEAGTKKGHHSTVPILQSRVLQKGPLTS